MHPSQQKEIFLLIIGTISCAVLFSFFDLGFLGATIALAIYTGLNLR